MALTRFELAAEARDKRKVAALERIATAQERIADALERQHDPHVTVRYRWRLRHRRRA